MTHASQPRLKSSIIEDIQKIEIARAMVKFGARLQIIVLETGLGRDRLSRLYREIRGSHALSKGLLPFAEEWYTSWLNNIHSSCFYAYFEQVMENYPEQSRGWHLVQAYTLYTQSELARHHAKADKSPPLNFTRAWVLTRLVAAGALQMRDCSTCSVPFIARADGYADDLICKVCNPPKRSKNSILCRHAHEADECYDHHDYREHQEPVLIPERHLESTHEDTLLPTFANQCLPLFPLETFTH